jgi:hypothetical protein
VKHKFIWATPLLLLIFLSFQQSSNPLTIIKKHNDFAVDHMGNIYLVNESELLKYLPSGQYYNRYSNLKLGTISSLDATNSLRLLLFYKNYQQIVFLDNQLSVKNQAVSLEEMGYEQTELVCQSANNGFWIFNKANNEILRFDEDLKRLVATGNLKQILQREMNPNFMTEHNGYLFLNCPESGIYVFDMFGTFNKVIALKNLSHFQVNDGLVYYVRQNKVFSYHYKLFEEASDTLQLSNVRKVFYMKGKLAVSNNDTLMSF